MFRECILWDGYSGTEQCAYGVIGEELDCVRMGIWVCILELLLVYLALYWGSTTFI